MKFGDQRLPQRFWAKVAPDASGCWVWTGGTAKGYGQISLGGRRVRAHRLAYQIANGTIDPGLEIDHLCENKRCVNPQHLEQVTGGENTRRHLDRHPRATCAHGHALTSDNSYARSERSKRCKLCAREYMRDYMRKRAAKRKAEKGAA